MIVVNTDCVAEFASSLGDELREIGIHQDGPCCAGAAAALGIAGDWAGTLAAVAACPVVLTAPPPAADFVRGAEDGLRVRPAPHHFSVLPGVADAGLDPEQAREPFVKFALGLPSGGDPRIRLLAASAAAFHLVMDNGSGGYVALALEPDPGPDGLPVLAAAPDSQRRLLDLGEAAERLAAALSADGNPSRQAVRDAMLHALAAAALHGHAADPFCPEYQALGQFRPLWTPSRIGGGTRATVPVMLSMAILSEFAARGAVLLRGGGGALTYPSAAGDLLLPWPLTTAVQIGEDEDEDAEDVVAAPKQWVSGDRRHALLSYDGGESVVAHGECPDMDGPDGVVWPDSFVVGGVMVFPGCIDDGLPPPARPNAGPAAWHGRFMAPDPACRLPVLALRPARPYMNSEHAAALARLRAAAC